MHRFFVPLIVIGISLGSAPFTAAADEWVFAGFRIHNYGGPPKTYNKIPMEYGFTWLKKDDHYSEAKEEFKQSIKAGNEGAYIDFYFASPSTYKYVAIYKVRDSVGTWKGPKIEITKYRIYKGKSKERIQKLAAEHQKKWKYLSSVPIKWIDLNSDRRQEKVSEVLTRQARNQQGSHSKQGACDAAIAAAARTSQRECTISKQGELVDLKPNTNQSAEGVIPLGSDNSVGQVARCLSCNQSGQSGQWFCDAKVTLRCQYTNAVEGTGVINQLRGVLSGEQYTPTDNPCTEDPNTYSCREYRKWLKMNRSQGVRN